MPASIAAPTSSTWTWTFHRPRPADHDEAVPEGVEHGCAGPRRVVLGVEEVHHLVGRAVLGEVVARGWGAAPGCGGPVSATGSGRRPVETVSAASRTTHSPRPPASTTPASASCWSCSGVCSRASRAAAAAAAKTSRARAPSPSAHAHRGVGGGAGDGEDGALDRASDGGVAGVGRLLHRLGRDARAALAGGHPPQAGGVRTEHLAQDHAGVAARPQQRAAGQDRQRVAEGEVGSRPDGLAQRVAGGGDGEEHVGAGVTVGHRVDVEGVDLLAGRAERVGGDVDEAQDRGGRDAVGYGLHPCVPPLSANGPVRVPQGSARHRLLRFHAIRGRRIVWRGCPLTSPRAPSGESSN